jgi:S-formylglutathione hydrolase FrmB
VLSLGLVPSATAAEPQVIDQRTVAPRTLELTVRTDALAEPTRLRVVVPQGYSGASGRRWPTVYLLHSAFGDYRAWTDAMAIASLAGDFPAIFVMPDGGRGGFYSDWWNGGAGGPPEWERYHVRELVPLIDSIFRTRADRTGRVLLGGSMGGLGAMSYAARHPDLFAGAVSISGAVDTNYWAGNPIVTTGPAVELRPPASVYGPRLTEEVRWRAHNPVDLAENLRGLHLQVRTYNGLPGNGHDGWDFTERVVHEMSVSFHNRLDQLRIPHQWADYGPGGHTIDYARVEVVDALNQLRGVIDSLPPAPKRFDFAAVEPRFSVWGWSFAADPRRALEFLRVSGASRGGLTLTGSGTETVTTAPFYRRARKVVVSVNGVAERVRPDRSGRITFAVDLGPPHTTQQYRGVAGESRPGYFQSRTVSLVPRGVRRRGR